MARLELTLHHHIDSTAGTLSRLITDKHDGVMDQSIRRLENLEETVSRGFRTLKADLKDVKKDIGILKGEFQDVVTRSDKVQETFGGLNGKLEALEKAFEEHGCKCQLAVAERSPGEPESELQKLATSHRRTESAHGALGQGEQCQQHRSGASRSSTSARHSGNSNRTHYSDKANSQLGDSMSDERDARRAYFAELGAARGPKPDLKDHPAISGMQQRHGRIYGHDQHTMSPILPYEHPSLTDGRWYQQAYGQ